MLGAWAALLGVASLGSLPSLIVFSALLPKPALLGGLAVAAAPTFPKLIVDVGLGAPRGIDAPKFTF